MPMSDSKADRPLQLKSSSIQILPFPSSKLIAILNLKCYRNVLIQDFLFSCFFYIHKLLYTKNNKNKMCDCFLNYVPSRFRGWVFSFWPVNMLVSRIRKSRSTQSDSYSGGNYRRNFLRWCRPGHSPLSPRYQHDRKNRPGHHHPNRKR